MVKTTMAVLALAALVGVAAPASANPGDQALINGKVLNADAPAPGGVGYTFSTTTPLWSAVAIMPTQARDVDLSVYTNGTNGTFVGESVEGASLPDFVAIDTSRRAPGTYRAVVSPYGTSAPYSITWSAPAQSTAVEWASYSIPDDQNLRVHDIDVKAGVCTAIVVWGTTQNTGAAYLYKSVPSDPSTWVVGPTSPTVARVTYKPGDHPDY
jgi:hypothetical protein